MSIDLARPYNRQAFLELVESLLPSVGHDTRAVTEVASHFSEVLSLGSSPKLDLQIFEVKVSGSLDKRTAIASDGFKLMKLTASYRCLVAFYSDDTNQWRLSLMTAQPTIDNGKVVTTFSNPKRHSYLLGPGSKLKTPNKQLISKGQVTDFEDLSKRFAVEVVNNEFYKEIAKLYDELVGSDQTPGILKYPDPSEASHEFAVRLIGRIIFCWFLREKRSDSGTPLVPGNILSRDAASENNYYHSTLTSLFFEVLNKHLKNREDKFQRDHYASIPYLNGGLFSPDPDDYYEFDKALQLSVSGLVEVPDTWLRKLFDLLELYNFTVDENTSYDIDLSIDPEMLGRIFENLLARINPETGETVRRATGSFYTPREIVEYMVDQSLKEYLKNVTKVSEDKIAALVSYDALDDLEHALVSTEKQEIIRALGEVRILDPACGSGAFPIGILQKIVFMLQQVDPDSKEWLQKQIAGASPELINHLEQEFRNRNFNYIRKLGVIRESIYGIDIQPIATEIARLRCFLTLIVDQSVEDHAINRGIEPLPNLDFKFVTANSLVNLDGHEQGITGQMGLFEDTDGINELKRLRNEYFSSHDSKKTSVKEKFSQRQLLMLKQINAHSNHHLAALTRQVSTWDPFGHHTSSWFDPEWMFGIADGFDIIIGNPPYIDSEGMINSGQVETRQYISDNYKFTKGNWDIYIAFFEKGLSLLGEQGILIYITPDKWVSKSFGNALRDGIIDKIQSILVAGRNIFITANVDSLITTINKIGTSSISISEYANQKVIDKCNVPKHIIKPPYTLDFLFSNHLNMLLRVENDCSRLGDITFCENACATSDAYKLKPLILDSIDGFDPVKHLKIINTGTISKYSNRWGISKMTYLNDKYLHPIVDKNKFNKEFPNSYSRKAQARKIIIKGLNLLDGCLDDNGTIIPGKTTLIVTSSDFDDLLFALGIINSKFALFYLRQKYSASSYNQGTTFTKDMINNFPIPKVISADNKRAIIDQVSIILEKKAVNPHVDILDNIEQVNMFIYKLYELAPEDIDIIESKN